MAVIDLVVPEEWGSTDLLDDRRAADLIDADLVVRAQRGDRRAFSSLYERHHRAVLQLCSRQLRNRDDAADAAQETFLRAWRALGSLHEGMRFYPWLSVIARNVCIDALRRSTGTTSFDEAGHGAKVEPAPATDQALMAAADAAAITAALDRLSERHREILHLREFAEWSYERIATEQQLELNAVKSLVWRARQALRREYLTLMAEDSRFAGLFGPLLFLRRLLAGTRERVYAATDVVSRVASSGMNATGVAAVSVVTVTGAVVVAGSGGGPLPPLSPPVQVQMVSSALPTTTVPSAPFVMAVTPTTAAAEPSASTTTTTLASPSTTVDARPETPSPAASAPTADTGSTDPSLTTEVAAPASVVPAASPSIIAQTTAVAAPAAVTTSTTSTTVLAGTADDAGNGKAKVHGNSASADDTPSHGNGKGNGKADAPAAAAEVVEHGRSSSDAPSSSNGNHGKGQSDDRGSTGGGGNGKGAEKGAEKGRDKSR